MSTKGSWQRPKDDDAWGSNFERIFGKCVKHIEMTEEDIERAVVSGFDIPSGRSTAASATGSNPDDLGSSPSAPAIYIDPETGE